METLSFSLGILSFQLPYQSYSSLHLKTHFSNAIFSPRSHSFIGHKSQYPQESMFLRRVKNDGSRFLDEDGVIDDMDGYLNDLSLEYDSVWDTKPAWCQPWTIILTGVLTVAGSWVLLHSLVITGIVLSLICAWWYIFLYAYPKVYSDMIIERRKMVSTGAEDTFGRRRVQ